MLVFILIIPPLSTLNVSFNLEGRLALFVSQRYETGNSGGSEIGNSKDLERLEGGASGARVQSLRSGVGFVTVR